MSKNTSFNVYNASAGSGKTFTLVKEYLKLLLQSKHPNLFRNILALTFTNKAVGEMKSRIIETLKQFSNANILKESNSMFEAIVNELGTTPEIVHKNSKTILNNILHNYAAFDISTIDRFTHKVIRTFAFDLKIPVNFEVELDTDSLLSEAVDSVIAKAGVDKELTKILVDFAIEKADDDKSWDVSFDLNKIAKLLVNENDAPYLNLLKDKTLDDFKRLKAVLRSKADTNQKAVIEKANQVLTLIEECGLEHNDFSGRNGYVPSHFVKLTNGETNIIFDKAWMANIESQNLYPKTTEASIASIIDDIQAKIVVLFNETKELVTHLKFLKNFYKNITPLSVLNIINKELNQLKEDKNVLLISEFNKTIHDEIKNQPTPFIYERLGEKFRHYFIDEFQDTSKLQWENLIPLIDNRIASENGSAMIVGDAKQSIYRWRGGKPELFIDLYNKASKPFTIEQEVKALEFNYRSCKTIVEFNNAFFKHLSSFAFQDTVHSELYLKAKQEKHLEGEGFVNIEFLEIDQGEDRDELYPEAVKKTIENILSNGFELRDICVLVRKKKEGVAVADYLSENNIDIISSETLLINRSPKVRFVINMLKLSIQPENKELKVNALYFISVLLNIENKHGFLKNGLELKIDELTDTLKGHGINFNFRDILQLSLYHATEYIVRAFNLVATSDAYVQFLLDVVLDYSQKNTSSILDFLAYWEKKKGNLSITIPNGKNAVQIMTIHKSKGLEFPVVIFPYADLNIYREKEPKVWFPIEEKEFSDFSFTSLNYNKDIEGFGETGKHLYETHQAELELDNTNLLYVTLTRAVEQLHIISKKDIDSKGNERLNEYSGLLINYLKAIGKWSDNDSNFSFGSPLKQLKHETVIENNIISKEFISNNAALNIVTNSGFLWDTEQGEAIDNGNLIHDILSKIEMAKDIDFVINDAFSDGLINKDEKSILKNVINSLVNHPDIKYYFSNDVLVYNERDIISSHGSTIRPDRLVIDKNKEAIIIDYKTGAYDKKHEQQLITYADVIETMNIKVNKKILIYINDDITVKEI